MHPAPRASTPTRWDDPPASGVRLIGYATVLCVLNVVTPIVAGADATAVTMLLWALSTVAVAVALHVRERNLAVRDVVIGSLLGLAAASGFAAGPLANPAGTVLFGVWTLAGWLVAVAAFTAVGMPLPLLSWQGGGRWSRSLAAAAVVGGALAVVNQLASLEGRGFDPSWRYLVQAIQPGVMEEVAMRLALVAIAVYLIGGWPTRQSQVALIWLVGVVPHSFAHAIALAGDGQVLEALRFTVTMSLVFGAPLFLLTRRFGLVAAIGAHWLIDVVRFVTTGGLVE